MLETELKAMLTKELYNTVNKMYPWDSQKLQKNFYYFDKHETLLKNRSVFRIRQKDGDFKIQVKIHKNSDSPLQICEELEYTADCAPEQIEAEKAAEYTGLKTGELYRAGFNETLRNSFMWNETTEICLDKTTYFDVTDYEIEIEYKGELPQELIDELDKAGVKFDKSSVGKYSRFLKRLSEMSRNE